MDNASKALIMAGGVLISILVISISLYIYTSATGFANTSNDVMTSSAVASFNRYYQSFGGDIKGIDALNIYNKAIDDQEKGYNITINGNITSHIAQLNADNGVGAMTDNYTYSCSDENLDGYIDLIIINKN